MSYIRRCPSYQTVRGLCARYKKSARTITATTVWMAMSTVDIRIRISLFSVENSKFVSFTCRAAVWLKLSYFCSNTSVFYVSGLSSGPFIVAWRWFSLLLGMVIIQISFEPISCPSMARMNYSSSRYILYSPAARTPDKASAILCSNPVWWALSKSHSERWNHHHGSWTAQLVMFEIHLGESSSVWIVDGIPCTWVCIIFRHHNCAKNTLFVVLYLFFTSLSVPDRYTMGRVVSFFHFWRKMHPTCLLHAFLCKLICPEVFAKHTTGGDPSTFLKHS